MASKEALTRVLSFIPPLSKQLHKGQAGRIGIVGGCTEYSGAPYYSAVATLRGGADISHVFCAPGAGPVIKAYSPELIVHPYLCESTYAVCRQPAVMMTISDLNGGEQRAAVEEATKAVCDWLPRIHVLVVGPGLGRDPVMLEIASRIMREARRLEMPLVVDADGLFLVTQRPELIANYPLAILTPNRVEFIRLCERVLQDKSVGTTDSEEQDKERAVKLSANLGHVVIVRKGASDFITDGHSALVCEEEGSPRRCGGQGDMLSGFTATFAHWAKLKLAEEGADKRGSPAPGQPRIRSQAIMHGCYGAAILTRTCSRLAFAEMGRCMVTPDMLNVIPKAFEAAFPSKFK